MYIVINRQDDLGARLKSMLNGMLLAEYSCLEFRFVWTDESEGIASSGRGGYGGAGAGFGK